MRLDSRVTGSESRDRSWGAISLICGEPAQKQRLQIAAAVSDHMNDDLVFSYLVNYAIGLEIELAIIAFRSGRKFTRA